MTNEEAMLNCKIFCDKCKKWGIGCDDCWRKNALEALEKQIPKKPHRKTSDVCPNYTELYIDFNGAFKVQYYCPACNTPITKPMGCPNNDCRQAIDWSDDND